MYKHHKIYCACCSSAATIHQRHRVEHKTILLLKDGNAISNFRPVKYCYLKVQLTKQNSKTFDKFNYNLLKCNKLLLNTF